MRLSSSASQEWCSIRPDQLQLIGDAIRPGTYSQHSVFRRVANYTGEDGLVSLVDPSVGAGPSNIVVSPIPDFWPETIVVTDTTISFDGLNTRIDDQSVFRSTLDFVRSSWSPDENASHRLRTVQANLHAIIRWFGMNAPTKSLAYLLIPERISDFQSSTEMAFAQRMYHAAATWQAGAFTAAVALAKGCGFGLTPSGDDFNAGLLIGLQVVKNVAAGLNRGEQVYNLECLINKISRLIKGSNVLANAFLASAVSGRVTGLQKRFIESLFEEESKEAIACAAAIIATGETSGADWLTGFLLPFKKEFELWLSLAE